MNLPPVTDLTQDHRIRKILILKWSALGDLVIATAIMDDLYRAFPKAQIHLNTLPSWHKLFENDPRFQKVLALEIKERKFPFSKSRNWLRTMRREQYDLIIDLQSNDHSRILLGLLKLTSKRSLYYVGMNDTHFPYDLAPKGIPTLAHSFTRMKATMDLIGVPNHNPRPSLHIPNENKQNAQRLLKKFHLEKDGFFVFLPGCQAAGYLKRWGAERYATLGKMLHERGAKNIVLIGGPDEIDECEKIEKLSGSWLVNLCGKTQILDIVPICEDSLAIVGNDTGTGHIVSTLNKPIFVICGPTDPARIAPIGPNVQAIQANAPCLNCYQKHCTYVPKHICMEMTTPAILLEKIHSEALANPIC